ncbi:hypothetical protein KC332_g10031 [Hortaea werneckii]|nr:hypothetical protein KC358_g13772 [Hortaea werneckii]KAI6814586.1 hypothetical protein KC350_g11256 [Hortaea werneckii]KAI6908741.1 hypothetical protein KC348_g13746 [Hortaea werneckii]KAI6925311.1 hypothetical protein KC341_g13498 [Hortaea werneckii]KAI6959068.1 hypothetical protein KC321_g13638 [Hortaea werneckii]
MSRLIAFLLASLAGAQSLIPASHTDSAFHTNTCLRRSVYVYTSDSSTYVVTDLGTTSLAANPTYCANASISTSTVYGLAQTITTALPAPTVTVYQQQTLQATLGPSTAQPAATVLADSGFEAGNENPFNTSSSGAGVSAAVVQSGPLLPFSGDSYLLITFDEFASSGQNVRRQANAPLTYNVTQQFPATAGTSYSLSAYAAQAASGASEPSCSLTICADSSCGSPASLSSKYSLYSYVFNALVSESDAVATFSVTCDRSAYVALDNVTISSNSPGAGAGVGASALMTSTVFVTLTATLTLHQSQVYTEIETTTVVRGSTLVLTSTVPTVLYQTATLQPSEPATRTLNHTATQTATIQVGNVETKTLNFTGTETTTLWNTATAIQAIAETKFFNVTVSEHLTTTTVTEYQTLTASALPQTVQLTQTLPGETATFTLPPETLTLPAETATSLLPPETFTLPAETATFTLPAETYTLPAGTATSILPPETLTLPAETATFTLPAKTYTLPAETTSMYGPTITETYIPATDLTSSTEVSPSETSSSSEEYTPSSTSEEPIFVPQPTDPDVPAVALASPTNIIGDIYGSPNRYDDVSLPVVGLTALNYEYTNTALPYYGRPNCETQQVENGAGGTMSNCFLETGALALWDEPSRQVTFEFYLSHIEDATQYYHYLIRFWEARPNIVSFQYLNVSDWGCSATVGVESQEAGLFQQYSNSQPTVYPGLQLTFDTSASNSHTVDSPGDTSVPPQNCPGYNGGSEHIRKKKMAGVNL